MKYMSSDDSFINVYDLLVLLGQTGIFEINKGFAPSLLSREEITSTRLQVTTSGTRCCITTIQDVVAAIRSATTAIEESGKAFIAADRIPRFGKYSARINIEIFP